MIDLTDYPDIISTINAIINNKGVAEIKTERNGAEIVVVEINRAVKTRESKEC